MKAVILAAGKSTRTYPLTVDSPKALLKIAGKPLLAHCLDNLVDAADEAIIVVGFKKEMIRETFGKEYNGIKLTYCEQAEQLGTGHALMCAEPFLGQEQFIMMTCEDLFSRSDLKKLVEESPSVLAQEVNDPSAYGVWIVKDGHVSGFQEKSANPESNLANTSIYVLGPEIFIHTKKLRKTERGEFELNEAVFNMSKEKPVRVVKSDGKWQPVGYPWDILDANKLLLDMMVPINKGKVEPGVTIHGKVSIGKGTVVKAGTYIEGPVMIGEDCIIGPNAHIRQYSCIGDKCKAGNSTEIKNAVLGDKSKASHFNYLADSVVGREVNLGGYTFTCNLRHDRDVIRTPIKGVMTSTGKNKFGTVIGDGTHLGANTKIYPGRKIWPGKTTLPGEIVKKDLE
jgi:UDP-N-acetylglucosamine diphosphorylase / glucose-1-phosphate thymidylyltransferase / UDP-N-acetylgalactosamine diphosphorylase / glucosamine-1-phosphate N-acetyltransferase / galactosamine-1-phosphate N-acetyltransferase